MYKVTIFIYNKLFLVLSYVMNPSNAAFKTMPNWNQHMTFAYNIELRIQGVDIQSNLWTLFVWALTNSWHLAPHLALGYATTSRWRLNCRVSKGNFFCWQDPLWAHHGSWSSPPTQVPPKYSKPGFCAFASLQTLWTRQTWLALYLWVHVPTTMDHPSSWRSALHLQSTTTKKNRGQGRHSTRN